MTDADLDAILAAHTDPGRTQTHHAECHLNHRHAGCAVGKLVREVKRLREELDAQKAVNVKLAERCAGLVEIVAMRAERVKVPFDLEAIIAAQAHKGGVGAIMGEWPGDETDEQITAALRAESCRVQGHTGECG